jgi:hypothetical protein
MAAPGAGSGSRIICFLLLYVEVWTCPPGWQDCNGRDKVQGREREVRLGKVGLIYMGSCGCQGMGSSQEVTISPTCQAHSKQFFGKQKYLFEHCTGDVYK